MDEDRRQFLTEALQSLTSDHVKRLQQLMDTLAKPDDDDQTDVEEKEDALEELNGTLWFRHIGPTAQSTGHIVTVTSPNKSSYES